MGRDLEETTGTGAHPDSPTQAPEMLFPPELVSHLADDLDRHPALTALPRGVLARLLTLVFFTSLVPEEAERHPVRVAFAGSAAETAMPPAMDLEQAVSYRWRTIRFRRPMPCDRWHLLKLSRAARENRLFAAVGFLDGRLQIIGLAREGLRTDDDDVIKLVAPSPGVLAVSCGARRVLDYVHGRILTPPENVLLGAGPVRRALSSYAAAAGVTSGYIDAVASLVRQLSAHPYGGILVLSDESDPDVPLESGFTTEAEVSLTELLQELSRQHEVSTRVEFAEGRNQDRQVIRDVLRAEMERMITDIGRLTAIDGATVLDRRLGLRGFGVILPILPRIVVVEATESEPVHTAPFPLRRRGSRHRAAASYAATHPASVVFVASASGDIGCMLRDPDSARVLLWRFRRGDLRFVRAR